jgi:hypothetical protein
MTRLLSKRGWRAGAAALLAVVLVFGLATPTLAGPIFQIPPWHDFHWLLAQGIKGTVTDASTAAPIAGIIVSSYETSTGAYISSAVTAGDGTYTIGLGNGTYRLQFRDPAARYGEEWYSGQPNFDSANNRTVTTLNYTSGNEQLNAAAAIKTVARRDGHTLTLLPGIFVIMQQKDASNNVHQWSATTGGNGAVAFGGLLPGTTYPKYKESGIDPTGRLYSTDASDWHTLTGGATTLTYLDMVAAGASREITPSVPSTKYTHKKNKKFGVSGTFSKAIANGTQIKILAVKGSTQKVFSGKIKSSKYSSTVKLGKGYWTLYALFKGNSTFAANDSLLGKAIHVK